MPEELCRLPAAVHQSAPDGFRLDRRHLIKLGAVGALSLLLPACGSQGPATSTPLEPGTPTQVGEATETAPASEPTQAVATPEPTQAEARATAITDPDVYERIDCETDAKGRAYLQAVKDRLEQTSQTNVSQQLYEGLPVDQQIRVRVAAEKFIQSLTEADNNRELFPGPREQFKSIASHLHTAYLGTAEKGGWAYHFARLTQELWGCEANRKKVMLRNRAVISELIEISAQLEQDLEEQFMANLPVFLTSSEARPVEKAVETSDVLGKRLSVGSPWNLAAGPNPPYIKLVPQSCETR